MNNLEQFWSEKAKHYVKWLKPWNKILEGSFQSGELRWFIEGKLNISANCIDKHLPEKANQPAIIWEGDEENQQRKLSFSDLHEEVCRMANVLK